MGSLRPILARELLRVTEWGGVVIWVVNDAILNGSETGTGFKQFEIGVSRLGSAVVVTRGVADHREGDHVADFGGNRFFGADDFCTLGRGFGEKVFAFSHADRFWVGLDDFAFRALVEVGNHDLSRLV